ncbi:MAG: DNA-processing protein DprA [Coriobacteriia bacterium]|nr:DNA-processing protein DprA [Coriobacteriia bacterium]
MGSEERFELSVNDRQYPQLLREIDRPPEVLYGIGDPSALSAGLAVVGARHATPYGLKVASQMTGWAARAGYTIISGGAVGCDQAAHRAALEADGVTVAVFAGGADVTYPRAAAQLFRSISREGAIVSEMAWGTEPQPWLFRRRNRLIAGLSAAVLVVEAGLPSGTLSTVEYALAAGREVLSIPGSIFSPNSRGCNRLLREGATMITEPSDLRDALMSHLGPPASDGPSMSPDVRHLQDRLVAALCAEPMRPDDAALFLGHDIVTVLRRVGVLEAQGAIRRYPDGKYGP